MTDSNTRPAAQVSVSGRAGLATALTPASAAADALACGVVVVEWELRAGPAAALDPPMHLAVVATTSGYAVLLFHVRRSEWTVLAVRSMPVSWAVTIHLAEPMAAMLDSDAVRTFAGSLAQLAVSGELPIGQLTPPQRGQWRTAIRASAETAVRNAEARRAVFSGHPGV